MRTVFLGGAESVVALFAGRLLCGSGEGRAVAVPGSLGTPLPYVFTAPLHTAGHLLGAHSDWVVLGQRSRRCSEILACSLGQRRADFQRGEQE